MSVKHRMKPVYRTAVVAILLILPAMAWQGCQTLREIAALRLVDFAIDSVTDARLAGVQIERLRSYEDLSATDILRLSRALATQEFPLEFRLNIAAENPADNQVQARLVRMGWTLLLEDRETISGTLNESYVIPSGQTTTIPLTIQLDLVDFFDRNLQDLVNLALAAAGQGGEATNVKLQARPTIDTPLGEMDYPGEITIVSRDFGDARQTQ